MGSGDLQPLPPAVGKGKLRSQPVGVVNRIPVISHPFLSMGPEDTSKAFRKKKLRQNFGQRIGCVLLCPEEFLPHPFPKEKGEPLSKSIPGSHVFSNLDDGGICRYIPRQLPLFPLIGNDFYAFKILFRHTELLFQEAFPLAEWIVRRKQHQFHALIPLFCFPSPLFAEHHPVLALPDNPPQNAAQSQNI